ncbi:hypothetical protein EP30_03935 [Bifidobacterium sp. UTCIF-39]|uniref:MATE family efflux transporter n=1 Tax=Bifidobacterium sp. UTCIF-39 TaxID=1465359 RepID=UPI00112AFAC4|nr:MATE family efflux transporter [Bifidobacterium sp. UTCIF-39]TPF97104.1 hypothetical protein EP30_03935 [Bifidobacterium sp. UTCIF-39]
MHHHDFASSKYVQHLLDAFRGGGYGARDIYTLTYPVLVDTLFLTIVDFCNTGIISTSGPAAISAVNTAESLHWLLIGTFNAIALGATVLISQYHGANDHQGLGRTTSSSLQVMLAATVLYAVVVLFFEDPLIGLLFGSADRDVLEYIHIFLFGLLVSYPLRGFHMCVAGLLRGLGRTKITLVLSLVANGSNLALNIVFVILMHMGVTGLAWAAGLSQLIGALVASAMLRNHASELRLDLRTLFRINGTGTVQVIMVSLPFALEDLFFNGGKLIIQMFIVPFGTLQIAANGIIGSWSRLQEVPIRALSIAIVPIIGTSIGGGNVTYARKITRTFIIVGALSSALVGLVLLALFPWAITSYYHAPAEIHGTLWTLFIFTLIGYPLLFGLQCIYPATLRAAGDGSYATIASLASMWIYRIGIGYLVSVVLNYQIVGLWAVWVSEWAVRGLLFWLRYRTDRWTKHDLTSSHDAA